MAETITIPVVEEAKVHPVLDHSVMENAIDRNETAFNVNKSIEGPTSVISSTVFAKETAPVAAETSLSAAPFDWPKLRTTTSLYERKLQRSENPVHSPIYPIHHRSL